MAEKTVKPLNVEIGLKHFRCAVAAAEHGSFRRTAEALNVEQSTLSRSIVLLEHATSLTISNRSRSGVVVSTPGGDFIRMARTVLGQLDEFGPSEYIAWKKALLSVGFCTSLNVWGCKARPMLNVGAIVMKVRDGPLPKATAHPCAFA